MQGHRRTIVISLGLAVLTVTAFAQVVQCDFVNYDDATYVNDNPQVTAGLNLESVCWAFTSIYASNWHPLTWLSLQLDASLYGVNPAGYHLTNLLLHLATVVLLFLFLSSATGAVWRSAVVAAFFAVHPLRVESVAWVAERKDVLSGFFWMLTLIAYLHYVRRPGIGRHLLLVFVFALGLLAKAMLVTLPFVLALLDYWPLARLPWGQARGGPLSTPEGNPRVPRVSLRLLIWEKVPLLLLAIATAAATVAAQSLGVANLEELPLHIRVANALIAYVTYILQVFWPANLCVLYPHPYAAVSWRLAVAAGLLVLVVSVFVLREMRRRPYLLVGWCWYLGTLVPVVGLIQVGLQAHADRYTYLPVIGVFVMLAWGIPDLPPLRRFGQVVLPLFAAVLLAACVGLTNLQVRYWKDTRTLWEHVLAVDPKNAFAHQELARYLTHKNQLDEAIAHLREAVECEPKSVTYRARLVYLLRQAKRNDEADKEEKQIGQLASDPTVAAP